MISITVEIIEQLVHATVEAYVGTEVLQQTEQPLVLLITLGTLPDTWDSKHRATL